MIADDDVRRYRQAAEDALEQLDWCIGYLHGTGKRTITRQLARNRAYIRRNLMRAPAEPVPSDVTTEGEMCATRNRRAPHDRLTRRGSEKGVAHPGLPAGIQCS